MKQTAMQELISELEYSAKNSTNDLLTTTINYIIDMAKGKLEMEKQQQDEFAIGFAEWFNNLKYDVMRYKTMEEHLEIYKKEKEL